MKRDDTIYLRHILEAINKIEHYLGNREEEAFRQDSLIQDGVIRQILRTNETDPERLLLLR